MYRSFTAIVLTLLFALTFAACGGGANTQGSNSAVSNENASASPAAPAENAPAPEGVKLESEGGAEIIGSYYPPKKSGSPGIVLLHQWYSDRGSFDQFARELQQAGFAAISIDGRGFGESTKTIGGGEVPVSNSLDAVKAMLVDVSKAVEYLSKQKDVDPKRIAIVGSSYGSSQAIMYAGDHPDVKAVALLSPGLNYFNTMATGPAAEKYGKRPLFAVASKEDADSVEAVDAFREQKGAAEGNFFRIYPGKAHGTDLFKNDSGAEKDLLDFLRKSL